MPADSLRAESLVSGPALLSRGSFRQGFDLAVLRLDFLSGSGPLQSIDHNPVGRREPRANDTQTVHHWTQRDQLGADRAVIGDGEYDLARLIRGDGAVRQQQCLALTAEQPKPTEESGCQEA